MDAVLGILGTVGGIAGPIFGIIGRAFSNLGTVLTKFSIAIFIAGFLGILFAFLWFFFRYLDEKKLTLPAAVFTLFFFVFLSGNLLLIARDAQLRDAKAKEEAVQEEVAANNADAAPAEPSGEIAV